jgi:hypothetical protein
MGDIRVEIMAGADALFDRDGTAAEIAGLDAEHGCGVMQAIVEWSLWHELKLTAMVAGGRMVAAMTFAMGDRDVVTIHFE